MMIDNKLPNYGHNCALKALNDLGFSIKNDKLYESFILCCNDWPHRGVSNKEFNIACDYLEIKNQLKYVDVSNDDSFSIKKLPDGKIIALISGHYVSVQNRIGISEYVGKEERVFHYWTKLGCKSTCTNWWNKGWLVRWFKRAITLFKIFKI